MQSRLEELQRALHEADGSKRKLMVENCDLQHQYEEGERMAAQLSKDKTSLTTQLEDAKRLADTETRVGSVVTCDEHLKWRILMKEFVKKVGLRTEPV